MAAGRPIASAVDLPAQLRRRKHWDRWFALLSMLLMLIAVMTLIVLLAQLINDGLPRLNGEFLTRFPSRFPERAGIYSAWIGTLLVMLVTAVVAVPLGVAAGLYLEEYAGRNWINDVIEINVSNLAGIPSIIYGLLALGLFVYRLNLGQSIAAAGLTLALLIIPVVIVATREAVRAVPRDIREAAYALGATQWQMLAHHVLPYSSGGIMTGIIIGLSRAIGETAPVITIGALTFIAFLPEAPFTSEFPYLNFAWLEAPFTVLPIQMFNWLSRPQSDFQANAAAAGLVLIMMTLLMNALAIYLRYRYRRRIRW
ncbi:MAG: phosphate ABC transporter permease PstA [Wenzhouxiangellaceae bacterium]